jgi:fatty-acyl-CoA synthase
VKILEDYGLTEGACVSSVNPGAGERRAGSIGLPIPD